MTRRIKALCFFGTRPEAIKMAPVVRRLQQDPHFRVCVAVSAQHRDMLDQVLNLFHLRSDVDLDLMREGQSLFDVTAGVIKNFEPALDEFEPDIVFVHGDTTTTLGGALASYYKKIPVAHVEAGLRTHDLYRPFPEEANRRLTDALATLYFAPTRESERNLIRENLPRNRIFVTGNTVIDALLGMVKERRPYQDARLKTLMPKLTQSESKIILMTAHRRENFGAPFLEVCRSVQDLSKRFPHVHWVYPVHPNPNVDKPARRLLAGRGNVHLLRPVDYSDMVNVMDAATLVVTDSGGLQEEAPSLGKPVLVLREVTERPEAVAAGTVKLVGTDRKQIVAWVSTLLTNKRAYKVMANAVNPYGDGRASERIAQAVLWFFGVRSSKPTPFRPSR